MVPLRVCRARHDSLVEQVAYPQTKIVVVTSGWTKLTHRERAVILSPGDVAILLSRALVSGELLSCVETVTLYIDPEFLHQQLSWVNLSTPLSSVLRSAVDGIGPIVSLSAMSSERRTVVTQARMLAEYDKVIVRGFGLLSKSLAFLDRILHTVDPVSARLPRRELRTIVGVFQSDLAHQWTVTELSQLVNLFSSQLTRVECLAHESLTVLFRHQRGTLLRPRGCRSRARPYEG